MILIFPNEKNTNTTLHAYMHIGEDNSYHNLTLKPFLNSNMFQFSQKKIKKSFAKIHLIVKHK